MLNSLTHARAIRARAAKLGKTLTTFAKDDCRNFAIDFHASVPREIRDQVYGFLISSPPHLDVRPTGSTLVDKSVKWAFSEFVGPHFAREFVETYYEKMELMFDESCIKNIRTLLATDTVGHGVVPVDHLRFCEVWFKEDAEGNYALPDASEPNEFNEIRTEYVYQLGAFLDLKQGSALITFKIDLWPFCDFYSLCILNCHLELLGPLLHRYKEKNLSFKVCIMSYNKEAEGRWRDITSFWDMPLDALMNKVGEWKEIGEIYMTGLRKSLLNSR